MIRTADRMGHITEEDSFQNNLLEKIYGSVGTSVAADSESGNP